MAQEGTQRKAVEIMQPVPPIVEPPVPTEWKIPQRIVKRYGEFNLQALHSWWVAWGPQMMQGDRPLTYISGVQLFLSFNLHTGYAGPWCSNKTWYSNEGDVPERARKRWGDRVKLFLLMYRNYMRGNGVRLSQKMSRPNSSAVAKWVICYRLRWSSEMVDHIDKCISSQLGRQACKAEDLAALDATRTG